MGLEAVFDLPGLSEYIEKERNNETTICERLKLELVYLSSRKL